MWQRALVALFIYLKKKEYKQLSLKDLGNVTYYNLNNEINRPINGSIMLNKDKEALKAFSRKMLSQTIYDSIHYKIS